MNHRRLSPQQLEIASDKSKVAIHICRRSKVRIIRCFIPRRRQKVGKTEDVPLKFEKNISRKARLWVQSLAFPTLWTTQGLSCQRKVKKDKLKQVTINQNSLGKWKGTQRHDRVQQTATLLKEIKWSFRQAGKVCRFQERCTWRGSLHYSDKMVKEEL